MERHQTLSHVFMWGAPRSAYRSPTWRCFSPGSRTHSSSCLSPSSSRDPAGPESAQGCSSPPRSRRMKPEELTVMFALLRFLPSFSSALLCHSSDCCPMPFSKLFPVSREFLDPHPPPGMVRSRSEGRADFSGLHTEVVWLVVRPKIGRSNKSQEAYL